MKFTGIASTLALLASVASATPTPTVRDGAAVDPRTVGKRAAITDACDVGYGAGTTGGSGGTTTTVSTLAQFTAAATSDEKAVIVVKGAITGATKVKVGSNKSIIGKDSGAKLSGFTIQVQDVSNVIVRNLAISKVVGGDAIGVQKATNVWLDHLDLSSDMDHGKDYYDGLLDVTHACDYITISNVYFHDHYKASLVGHSNSNGDEDKGHLTVTYAYNHWKNINSRGPSFRFGTGHIYNNYYENAADGINSRLGAQILAQNNVFVGSKKPLYSVDNDGFAVAEGNDFGDGENTAPKGTFTKAPYTVDNLLDASKVKAAVVGTAGNTLSF